MDIDSIIRGQSFERPGSDIKKTGYLKKLKTGKRKFFVLRSTSSSGPARLEYYDSEKKFKANQPPKRAILLHTCFNINKTSDCRHGKQGIVLYTNDDYFTVLAQSEEEQESWLGLMLEFQNQYLPDMDMHKEHYEHVWQVTLQPKGLGQGMKAKTPYRLCLNSSTVSLVKASSSQPQFVIQLVTIRTVAHNDCIVCLEVGKVAPTGEGKFWFTVDDSNVAKHMHETLLHYMNTVSDPSLKKEQSMRKRSESHSSMSPNRQRPLKADPPRPASFYPPPTWHSSDATVSPNSPIYPLDQVLGSHRPRSNTAESRTSRASSHHDDILPEFIGMYNGETGDDRHGNVVPPDLSPPPSPGSLDEQMSAYMDMEKKSHDGGITPPSSYFAKNMASSLVHSHSKPEMTPTIPEVGTPSYMSMSPMATGPSHLPSSVSHGPPISAAHGPPNSASHGLSSSASHGPPTHGLSVHHGGPPTLMSAPIPIHGHSFSEPHHSTLPTVREGGSNEGYLPMDVSSSPASTSSMPRPDRARCMLSHNETVGLPPRTYSLGSKPVVKKPMTGYMEMGPIGRGSGGQDMSRAISAPHIIHKGRRDRDHISGSPTPSASPLSTSVKSDDSDSFMEYLPMRPRTASDSFNYRHRTSSFGKMQQTCRPRSSSHGQGTRPIIKLNKLMAEKSRISQDPLQRTSRESSLHGSFDSLRVSSESLRRMSNEMRQTSGSNASDYADARGTPSPQLKGVRNEADGYMNMQVGSGAISGRRSSPHRVRTDSNSSSRRGDTPTSERSLPIQSLGEDYTEMAPLSTSATSSVGGEAYINMDYTGSRTSISSDVKSSGAASTSSSVHSARQTDSAYMSMEIDNKNKGDTGRSVSMENVDTYVVYDPSQGANKPRTGSLGSKDKKVSSSRPSSARKSSSSTSGTASGSHQTSVSASSRKGGSSDSIRRAGRQSSIEKSGSLGKDFRKKSGSTGTRPSSAKSSSQYTWDVSSTAANMMPVRKLPPSAPSLDEPTDEYIEFTPTATIGDSDVSPRPPPSGGHTQSHIVRSTPSSIGGPPTQLTAPPAGGSSQLGSSPVVEDTYLPFAPGIPMSTSKSASKQSKFPYQQPSSHSSSSSKFGQPLTYAAMSKSTPETEYVGFEPGNLSVSPSLPAPPITSSSLITTAKHVEAKAAPEYIGFEPGVSHSLSNTGSANSAPIVTKPVPARLAVETSEYMGYQPASSLHTVPPPPSPTSAISYIQEADSPATTSGEGKSSEAGTAPSKSRFSQALKQPTLSFDSSLSTSKSGKPEGRPTSVSPRLPGSNSPSGLGPPPLSTGIKENTSDQKPSSLDQELLPPIPLLVTLPPGTAAAEKEAKPSPTPLAGPSGDYLGYNPAASPGSKSCKENTAPLPSPVSLIERGDVPFRQLTIEIANGEDKSGRGSGSKPSNQVSQTSMQGYQRQLSAPGNVPVSENSATSGIGVAPLSPVPSPLSGSSTPCESPSPAGLCSSGRHKHSSGSSYDSSSGSGRHKHASGPASSSSSKSRRVSSDSDKTLRKGSKSDSNSSLTSSGGSGGKSKRRAPSGEKSPLSGSAEKSPLSPRGSGEVFCGEISSACGKALEAKMIPVESKIRHSLGDMTGVVGVVNKEGQGLCRPGSTPCMQALDQPADQGSRSAGDAPISSSSRLSSSGGLGASTGGSRCRHSLSDINTYQSVAMTSSNLSPVCPEHPPSPTDSSNNNSSGSGDSFSSGGGGSGSEPSAKPLNYIKLDLNYMESQGEEGRSPRVKNRNFSDADDKQPPLSYAKIDFVKSQNLSKALQLSGNLPDSSSSKS